MNKFEQIPHEIYMRRVETGMRQAKNHYDKELHEIFGLNFDNTALEYYTTNHDSVTPSV